MRSAPTTEAGFPRLTEDTIPGVRRAWREVVARLREKPDQWFLVEEGASRSRAVSVRKSLRYYDGIEVSQRIDPHTQTLRIYALARKDPA